MGKEDMEAMSKRVKDAEKEASKKKKKEAKKQLKAQSDSFWKDFKKFITKGNVLDMAVGVVIGAAFSAIVNGLVKMVINPCIALIPGASSLDNWKTVLKEAVLDTEGVIKEAEVAILWGEWVQTIIQFLIIALSIFLAVRIIRAAGNQIRYRELEAQKAAEEKKKAEEKAKAEAAAAEAKAEAERKEAQLQEFYANVARQTQLLEELAKRN